jgi:hypothetical protein
MRENAHFLISKQVIFCWNDLLSSFEEEDAKGFAEIRTGDLQIKKLVLYPRPRKLQQNLKLQTCNIYSYFKKLSSRVQLLTHFPLLIGIYIYGCYFQVCSILVKN